VTASILSPSLNVTGNLIGSATLTKTGNGVLQLSGQNPFTGGVDLTAGGLLLGSSSAPQPGATGAFSGPLGSGTLTASDGTWIVATGTQTVSNPVDFSAFTGPVPFYNLTNVGATLNLNGPIALPNGAVTVDVCNRS